MRRRFRLLGLGAVLSGLGGCGSSVADTKPAPAVVRAPPPTVRSEVRALPAGTKVKPPAGATPQPETWESLVLPNGLKLSIEAESPGAAIGSLGVVQVRVGRPGAPPSADTITRFADLAPLATTAGTHEGTDATLKVVGDVAGATLVAINVSTRTGGDIRTTYFQSTLWATRPTSVGGQVKWLWSGPGGETHMAYQSCLYGVVVDLAVNAEGAVSRACYPFLTREKDADFSGACPRAKPEGCADSVVVPAGGVPAQ